MIEIRERYGGLAQHIAARGRRSAAPDVEASLGGRDGRFFWQLAAGEWNVRAVSRGDVAEENITVERMTSAD